MPPEIAENALYATALTEAMTPSGNACQIAP